MQKEILVGTLLGDDCAGAQASASMPFRKSQPVLCVKFEQNISKAHRLGRRPRTHNDPHHDHFILRSLAALVTQFVGSAKPTSANTEYSWGP